jgi:hypothetical protein
VKPTIFHHVLLSTETIFLRLVKQQAKIGLYIGTKAL